MASIAAFGATADQWLFQWRPRNRLHAWAAVATVSFTCYILARLLEGHAAVAASIIGVGACGWAWLVARALFDPSRHDARWAPMVAVIVAVTGAISVLAAGGGVIDRVAGNAYALSGSAALLLTFVEAFQRWRADLPSAEKRFRFAFTGVYALLVSASVMGFWVEGEGPGDRLRDDWIKGGCATVGLVAIWIAVQFRRSRPLGPAAPHRRSATAEDQALAERLRGLLEAENLAVRTELKVADVASQLGQPEYRVSQAITAAMGFANFNRWINHHRVARAMTILAEPTETRTILQIAFDCGFASLGPFNRAFRDETGMTPTRYRMVQRSR